VYHTRAGYKGVANFYAALEEHCGMKPSWIRELRPCDVDTLLASRLEVNPATLLEGRTVSR